VAAATRKPADGTGGFASHRRQKNSPNAGYALRAVFSGSRRSSMASAATRSYFPRIIHRRRRNAPKSHRRAVPDRRRRFSWQRWQPIKSPAPSSRRWPRSGCSSRKHPSSERAPADAALVEAERFNLVQTFQEVETGKGPMRSIGGPACRGVESSKEAEIPDSLWQSSTA
jgi:hypothetical protein